MTQNLITGEHFVTIAKLEDATKSLENYTKDSSVSNRIFESLKVMNFSKVVFINQYEGDNLEHVASILPAWNIREKIVITVQVRNRENLLTSDLTYLATIIANQYPQTKTFWILAITPTLSTPYKVSLFRDESLVTRV